MKSIIHKFQMPAYSMMDCDKETEKHDEQKNMSHQREDQQENIQIPFTDRQQLLEENENLKENIRKMRSDFLVLKQKIICTDTLIRKVREKHKYCELLEKKYLELRRFVETSKRDCEEHTREYQGLLLMFEPMRIEKETLEKIYHQREGETELLRNSVRSHEVLERQLVEAMKGKELDLSNCKKENKVLQNKLKKLEKARGSKQKAKEKHSGWKNVYSDRIDLEVEKMTIEEMALSIEATFSKEILDAEQSGIETEPEVDASTNLHANQVSETNGNEASEIEGCTANGRPQAVLGVQCGATKEGTFKNKGISNKNKLFSGRSLPSLLNKTSDCNDASELEDEVGDGEGCGGDELVADSSVSVIRGEDATLLKCPEFKTVGSCHVEQSFNERNPDDSSLLQDREQIEEVESDNDKLRMLEDSGGGDTTALQLSVAVDVVVDTHSSNLEDSRDYERRMALLYEDLLMSSDEDSDRDVRPDASDPEVDNLRGSGDGLVCNVVEDSVAMCDQQRVMTSDEASQGDGGFAKSCSKLPGRKNQLKENSIKGPSETDESKRILSKKTCDLLKACGEKMVGVASMRSQSKQVGRMKSGKDRKMGGAVGVAVNGVSHFHDGRLSGLPVKKLDALSGCCHKKIKAEPVKKSHTGRNANVPSTRKRKHENHLIEEVPSHPDTPALFKKFSNLSVEDMLSLVGVKKLLLPLPRRKKKSTCAVVGKEISKERSELHPSKDFVIPHPPPPPPPPLRGNVSANQLQREKNSNLCLSHSSYKQIHDCIRYESDPHTEKKLKDLQLNLLRLVKSYSQPMSPFLLDIRNSQISEDQFVTIVMKVLLSLDQNIAEFWMGKYRSNNSSFSRPWIPPQIARLVGILVSCGSSFQEGNALLEAFLKKSVALIISRPMIRGSLMASAGKPKDTFAAILCCCVVALLRTQGLFEFAGYAVVDCARSFSLLFVNETKFGCVATITT